MIKKSIKVIVILGVILIFLSGMMIGCESVVPEIEEVPEPEAPPVEEETPPDGEEAPPVEEETPPDEIVGGPGDPTIEFTYVPPYGSWGDKLKGRVWHVSPADYKVAVYIYLPPMSEYPYAEGWWTKPYWAWPLTSINADGTWSCSITTGGVDEYATIIAAYLVPNGYSPPSMSGDSTLPSDLDENALAKVITTRS